MRGGYLDYVVVHVFLELYGRNHIFECVVKRLEVGVDFVLHVAWQESEFFSGLDCRAREDNLAHLTVFQRSDSQGNGYVGLACTGGAEGKCEVVVDKCVDEFLLVGVACGDRLSVDAVDDYVVAFHLFRGVAFLRCRGLRPRAVCCSVSSSLRALFMRFSNCAVSSSSPITFITCPRAAMRNFGNRFLINCMLQLFTP